MKLIFYFLLILAATGCKQNIFDEIAQKDTDEAKYFQAKMEINNRNYSTAIILLESLTPSFVAARERVSVYASAYSGRCGLEFLTLLDNLQNTGASTILSLLMGGFTGADATNVQDCIDAETILDVLGDQSQRNGNENLLMAFNGLAKVGTILSSLADIDADGNTDGTFDQCNTTDLPEPMVREVGAGIAVALLSLAAIGTSYVDDALADVNALCALDPNLNSICTNTDPATFTANEVQALRYAIGSNDVGIDSCGGNNFSDCAAANPSCP